MYKLEVPRTIRIPNHDEFSNNQSIIDRLNELKNANIVEGYKLLYKDEHNKDLPFTFYSEINIDNSRLWDLFVELSNDLPAEVAFLFGHIDFEVNYGNYSSKKEILDFIKDFKKELSEDTFMNFGIIFHSEIELIEVFVDESKYIKFWGTNEDSFRLIMKRFKLNEIENLNFVDEYPKIRDYLFAIDKSVTETNELIEVFKNKFL